MKAASSRSPYQDLFACHAPSSGYYVTVNPQYRISAENAYKKSIRVNRKLHSKTFGKRYREKKCQLPTLIAIEGIENKDNIDIACIDGWDGDIKKKTKIHIHMLQQAHPELNSGVYQKVIRNEMNLGNWKKAVDVVWIPDPESMKAKAQYISKDLNYSNAAFRSLVYVSNDEWKGEPSEQENEKISN
jgi:hypothetical protein